MKVLLIGHQGYIGRGLHNFLQRDHEVVGWDKEENLFNLDAEYLARENFELLINLSVYADFAPAYQAGALGDEVNVCGARHLAKILKGSGITWIQMSTREVLGPVYSPKDVRKTKAGYRPKFLVNEEQPYAPRNFYGKSKIVAEFITESHPEHAIIRLTTCYTDYDHPEGSNWVLSLIRTAVMKKPVTLTQGGGQQFRDPLHADDLGRLMLAIHTRKAFGQRYHAGGGKQNLISLREFVQLVNPKVKIQKSTGGDYGFAFDIAKAAQLTGWKPQILVRERIPQIAESFKRRLAET